VSPLDGAAGSSGTGSLSSSGAIRTINASDLLVGANTVQTGATGPGSGFTQRIMTVPDGDIVEDQIVKSAGSYTATGPVAFGGWVAQMAAFRAASTPTSTPTPAPLPVKYVQGAYQVPQSPQSSVSVPYPGTQMAGNLSVVIVGWDDAVNSVSSVTDSRGNTYKRATGPVQLNGLSQSIYYASNIAAGSNTVMVTFTGSAVFPDIRILEYSGINVSNPFDVAGGAGGSGTLSSSGPITTSSANDLVLGANTVANGTNGPGAGFTQRMITVPNSDIVEDMTVNSLGSYSATAPLAPGDWVMQIVAFRAVVQPK
jgi:hypothetical protein